LRKCASGGGMEGHPQDGNSWARWFNGMSWTYGVRQKEKASSRRRIDTWDAWTGAYGERSSSM